MLYFFVSVCCAMSHKGKKTQGPGHRQRMYQPAVQAGLQTGEFKVLSLASDQTSFVVGPLRKSWMGFFLLSGSLS